MPFAAPGAYWLLLGPDARPMRADFDFAAAAGAIRATSCPQPGPFLEPMSEAEALRLFEPAVNGSGVRRMSRILARKPVARGVFSPPPSLPPRRRGAAGGGKRGAAPATRASRR
jgi:hypothetical protein